MQNNSKETESNSALFRLKQFVWLVPRLGLRECLDLFLYRATLRSGLMKLRTPSASGHAGPFFSGQGNLPRLDMSSDIRSALTQEVSNLQSGVFNYFGAHFHSQGIPPCWFHNPFDGTRLSGELQHWSAYNEFALPTGDIKITWEISRLLWAQSLAAHYSVTRESSSLELLNQLLGDWSLHNPLNLGPNWKCGQEAAIRVFSLLLCARLLGELEEPSATLLALIGEHCERISATLSYGLAQRNNHGLSEACALYLAGAWFKYLGKTVPGQDRRFADWQDKGRYWLENRTSFLFAADGSAAQHSVNYHRMMLDTLSLAESFRRLFKDKLFSKEFYERAAAAFAWLDSLVDPKSGDAPNLGANDGSRILSCFPSKIRDFRSSLQLSSVLFRGVRRFTPGSYDANLSLLTPECRPTVLETSRGSRLFAQGGMAVLNAGSLRAFVHAPLCRFRPLQSDFLHLDFWYGSQNLLRDAGTFSYWNGTDTGDTLLSTSSHNTLQFGSRNQMPRYSRFLFSHWCDITFGPLEEHPDGSSSWSVSCLDYLGSRHTRHVRLEPGRLLVRDEFSGRDPNVTLRWRLAPGEWRRDGDGWSNGEVNISVSSERAALDTQMEAGIESRHYLEASPVPVICVSEPMATGCIITQVALLHL
jgi:hypothetical protein